MSTALVEVGAGTPPVPMVDMPQHQVVFTPEKVELLKRTIADGATDDELELFLHVCKRTGLDPFARQIYAIKRKQWNPDTKRHDERMVIQTGIDGFRLIATRTGQLAGISDADFSYDPNGNLAAARVVVRRMMPGGFIAEFSHVALFHEYAQTDREGNPVAMWKKMPHNQLAKVAEAAALRKGFPAELSGVYGDDEMQQADSEPRARQPEPNRPPEATQKQIDLILKLKQSHLLSDKERRGIEKRLGTGMDKVQATEAIDWLQNTIKERKATEAAPEKAEPPAPTLAEESAYHTPDEEPHPSDAWLDDDNPFE